MENITILSPDINTHWQAIAPILIIRNEEEYNQAVERLNALIDEIGTNEEHPLYNLLETLGTLIEVYESENYPIPDCSGSEILAYLMQENGLTVLDLPEIGTPEIIERILSKNKTLTFAQIQQLAERFNVNYQVFMSSTNS
ncbi:transcriptional regulator [Crocosphaera sp.]|uniref:helix-turn-helix domain-containing protein n=1 Tax=Crocosphaera sp. TaxID=2729996 RepID=UPI0026135F74|nr:transcriptional regulator [Crocosphaera sp.]MDJ0579166.1 transcriptional regulator [Crocosphaera sp.]